LGFLAHLSDANEIDSYRFKLLNNPQKFVNCPNNLAYAITVNHLGTME